MTVFSKTDYAEKITLAEDAYYAGEYEKSMNCWKDVIKVNAFFEMAYLQMGKIHLHNGDNEEAMRCFELGNYRGDKITFMTGFNKAFTEFRKDLMSQYLGVMIIGAVVLVVASSVVRRIRQKKTGNGRERD